MNSPESDQSISERLSFAREQAGYTVQDLAERLGVMPASIEAWESGVREPRANRLMTLSGVLNVSLGWLIEGRTDDFPAIENTTTLSSVRTELENLDVQLGDARERIQNALASINQVGRRIRRGEAADVIAR
jgi:transcriptional regulator with XRE-family HTH domain